MRPDPLAAIVIDGYNLLFASGIASRNRGAGWLERERARLLDKLAGQLEESATRRMTIIFDRARQGQTPADFVHSSGIRVEFARDYQDADDYLEELAAEHKGQLPLVLVSSDQRVLQAAKSRKTVVGWTSDYFLTRLESGQWRQRFSLGEASPGARQGGRMALEPDQDKDDLLQLSEAELDEWLREFDL